MDIPKVLAELRAELDILNAAIASMERLQHEAPRKRASDIPKSNRRAARRGGVRTVTGIRKEE
ncbi:MAG: hypothetical protein ABSF25_24825 [Bryobacteraceae bacterium]|jgi:hypothetical protein